MGLFFPNLGHGDSFKDWSLYQVSKFYGNLNGTTLATAGSSGVLSFSASRVLSSFAGLVFAWFLGSCIWYRYLSPISNIPGPFLASFSRLWLIKTLLKGKGASELADLHEKYGE